MDANLERTKKDVKSWVDKIRSQLKGGMLYGYPVEEFGEDGIVLAAYLMEEHEKMEQELKT